MTTDQDKATVVGESSGIIKPSVPNSPVSSTSPLPDVGYIGSLPPGTVSPPLDQEIIYGTNPCERLATARAALEELIIYGSVTKVKTRSLDAEREVVRGKVDRPALERLVKRLEDECMAFIGQSPSTSGRRFAIGAANKPRCCTQRRS